MARSTVHSAPRSLPVLLVVRILFGGFGRLGWVLVAFGMVFVWIFDAGAGIAEWAHFSGDVETVQGTTTMYVFDLPKEGRSFASSSFDTGSWLDELSCDPRIEDRGELVVGRRGPPRAYLRMSGGLS